MGGHSFSVLIFKYLIIFYCPTISAPPKVPRTLGLSLLPCPPLPRPSPGERGRGALGPGADKPALMKPFLHSLPIYKLGEQPFLVYIFFLIPQCCKYHQRGYGRIFFLIYCRCKQNFKNKKSINIAAL